MKKITDKDVERRSWEGFQLCQQYLLSSILDRQQGSNTEHDAWNHIW